MRDEMEIETSDETQEYLDKWLHDTGAEAYYTANISLDMKDYDGAIKDMANHIAFQRALLNGKMHGPYPFKKTIRKKEEE